MVRIEYRVNGKKVSPGGVAKAVGDSISKDILDDIKSEVHNIVKDMKCPKHPSKTLKITLNLIKEVINIKLDGCCDNFLKEVDKAIS